MPDPQDTLHLRVLRLGDVALVTQPTELYCQFALDIRRRSPARHTVTTAQTNGHGGYCPTVYSLLTGGYSGEAIYWTRLEAGAGYKLVDEAARLLRQLWRAEESA